MQQRPDPHASLLTWFPPHVQGLRPLMRLVSVFVLFLLLPSTSQAAPVYPFDA